MRAAVLLALAACLGCHPAADPLVPPPACTPTDVGDPLPFDRAPNAQAWLGDLVEGEFVPYVDGQEVEAGPNPLGAGHASFVVPLRFHLPPDSDAGRCVWTLTDLGPQGTRFTSLTSEPVLFGVGSELDRLDGATEVALEGTLYVGEVTYRATAKVRPVNRTGYLSGK